MPRITLIDAATAQARLAVRTGGNAERAPLRDAIANMTTQRMLELEPDASESLRKLRLNVNRAAKEVGRPIEYGESDSGTLLVWLAEVKKTRAPRSPKPSAATD